MISMSYRPYLIAIIHLFCINTGLIAAESIAIIQPYEPTQANSNSKISILSIFKLTNISINGFKASELSGLAWDDDENILYALSDKGYLLHLRPVFEGTTLTDVLLLNGYALQDVKGNRLRWKQADSEGLAIQFGDNGITGDSILFVSFERHPRVIQYKPDGLFLKELNLPTQLQDIANYQSENKSLEAITTHPTFNVLIGVEQPLKNENIKNHTIFELSGNNWVIPLSSVKNSGLTGMTTFENGDLLILERGYSGLWPTFEIALHRISFNGNNLSKETVASFLSNNGLFDDNFEGITHYRNDYFFMVSDDNNHPFKRTLLIYFKISK